MPFLSLHEMGNQVGVFLVLYVLTCWQNVATLVVYNAKKDVRNGNCTVSMDRVGIVE